jgi:NitT/TauT family transport system permease protein
MDTLRGPESGGWWRKLGGDALYPLIGFGVLILLWEGSIALFGIPSYLLPHVHQVIFAFVDDFGPLLAHTSTTLVEILLGFAIAVLVAIPLSVAISANTVVEKTVYPLLVATQTIPKVAIAPLLLVWLGFGLAPKLALVVIMAFFPLVIATVAGLKATPLEMTRLGRSMGLTRTAMFSKIVLPYAMPAVFTGMKLATTLSVIGAVVGEFVGSNSGLGFLLIRSLANLDIELMFAALLVLTTIGVLFFNAVALVERAIIPWHISVRRLGPAQSEPS